MKNLTIMGWQFRETTDGDLPTVEQQLPTPSFQQIVSQSSSAGDFHTDTPYSYSVDRWTPLAGSHHSGDRRRRYDFLMSGTLGSSIGPVPSIPWNEVQLGDTYNTALKRLYSGVTDSDFNFAVSMGELKETIGIGGALLDETRKFARAVDSIPFPGLARKGKAVSKITSSLSSAWLSYAYGVRPLVSDIQGLSSLQPRESYSLKTKGSAASKWRAVKSDVVAGSTTSHEVVESYRFVGEMELENPVKDFMSRIHVTDVVGLAWELTTLSFVADWFIDIGGYLSLLADSRSYAASPQRTVQRRIVSTHTRHTVDYAYDENDVFNFTQGAGRHDSIAFQRTVMTSPPPVKLPTFKVPTGASQLLSAAALLRSIGLSRFR